MLVATATAPTTATTTTTTIATTHQTTPRCVKESDLGEFFMFDPAWGDECRRIDTDQGAAFEPSEAEQ